jgi:hypothetical protein
MKWLISLILLVALAIFVRYGSANPCEWMLHEKAEKSGVPRVLSEFILENHPRAGTWTSKRCLKGWWHLVISDPETFDDEFLE